MTHRLAMDTIDVPTVDRRKHDRQPAGRQASFTYGQTTATGVLVDISFFGALFEMDDDQALGAPAGQLTVPYSRDPEEAVRVSAKVVYRRNRSIGLSWTSLAPEDIIKVRRLAEGDPSRPWLLMRPAHTLFFLRRAG